MMRKLLFILLALILVALLLNVGMSFRPYNVLLITIDTLRADYLSCYNSDAFPTKNIDAIAKQSVLFEQDFSTIPITLPAHTSILTSRTPNEFLVFNNGEVFEHKIPMLPDLLEKNGYHTAAFVSLGVLKGSFGLNRGFNTYEDNFDKVNGRYYKVASEMNQLALPWLEAQKDKKFFAWIHYSDPHEPYITVNAPADTAVYINDELYSQYCIAKKEKNLVSFTAQPGATKIEFRAILDPDLPERFVEEDSQRFIDSELLVKPSEGIHFEFGKDFTDIHLSTGLAAKYFEGSATLKLINDNKQPVPLQLRFSGGVRQRLQVLRGYYAAEVQYVDEYVGKLWKRLGELGLLKNTIVIVTADHGEGLRTHGNLGHVDRLYNETIHVPLLIYYPMMGNRGTHVNEITNHTDIMPTVLDLLHIRNSNKMDGQSLKHYVTWSPIDLLFSHDLDRNRIFSATYSPEARVNSFSMYDGQMKLIHTPDKSRWQWEAYDMNSDPSERINIARFDEKKFNSQNIAVRKGILEEFRKEAEAAHRNQKSGTLTREQEEMFNALGYTAGQNKNRPPQTQGMQDSDYEAEDNPRKP